MKDIENKCFSFDFWFRHCLRFSHKNRKLQQPFSRGGPQRGDPTMMTSTITTRGKGDPQHMLRFRNILSLFKKGFKGWYAVFLIDEKQLVWVSSRTLESHV